jgi:hypothetical protein
VLFCSRFTFLHNGGLYVSTKIKIPEIRPLSAHFKCRFCRVNHPDYLLISRTGKTAPAPVTREEIISQIVKKFGGDSIIVKLDSILVDQGGYRADVEYTIKDRKNVMLSKAMDIMKELFTDPALSDVQSCMLRPQTIFILNNGEESVSQAAKLVLYRKVAQKVVWANLTYEMYENLLKNEGQLWIHPGMR